ncbi:MAG: tetratricopeptide repeat protein [Saprospiraceae bacterium]|nr:tetratricopeptide repeat protein [Saprospiraceae bacterium]
MQTQVQYKVIIQGKLELASEKTMKQVIDQITPRLDTHYKRELIFKQPELIFKLEDYTLDLGRYIGNVTEKYWKNTINFIEYCAGFASAGSVDAWMTDSGKILQHYHIEPKGEKSCVMLYQSGKKTSEQKGAEKEAIQILTEAIEKFERHSQAYTQRGYMNYTLKNYDDALYDFKKAISFDNLNSSAHYGVARTYMIKKNYSEAINSLEETTKSSIALQPIYWAARRTKAYCHLELKQYEQAINEFKLVSTRNFEKSDSNFKHLPMMWFSYGKAFFATGKLDEALHAFDKSESFEDNHGFDNRSELFMQRGLARKAAGKADFIIDLKRASELGNEDAVRLLSELQLS